jgi:hypothetical protein
VGSSAVRAGTILNGLVKVFIVTERDTQGEIDRQIIEM